jgi:fructose-1,6-bisphosphatase/inositol monophosphatase family enzyme
MPSTHQEIAQHLTELVQRVGKQVQNLQGHVRIAHKGPADRVTEADELSHRLIMAELSERYPGVALVMEEQDNPPQLPATCFVVDELDGTNLYSCGGEEYAVTIALIEAGEPVVGVMHQPVHQQSIVAVRGAGAFRNQERIRLDQHADLDSSLVVFELNRHVPEEGRAQLLRLADRTLGIRILGTAVGGAMEVLRGRAALYTNWRGAKVWDFAAGALAIREAGGVALSARGEPLLWDQVPMSILLAANEDIAAAAVSCIAR